MFVVGMLVAGVAFAVGTLLKGLVSEAAYSGTTTDRKRASLSIIA